MGLTIGSHGSSGPLVNYSALSFARNSVAYEERPDGSLVSRAINTLRRNSLGHALIEGQYTQVVRNNEDPSAGIWTASNCTFSDAAFQSPDPLKGCKQITATANGDASISQTLASGGSSTQANFSVYLRTDDTPQNVTISIAATGATTASKTVLVSNVWQRVDVTVRPSFTLGPTVTVAILGASANARVAVWGADVYAVSNYRTGHLPSHFTTGSSTAVRGQDILTGTLSQIPLRMKNGVWGFYWTPLFDCLGDGSDPPMPHEDITFFAFGDVTHEILWVAPDPNVSNPTQLGDIFVRNGTTVPVSRSNPLRFNRGTTMFVLLNAITGQVSVSGALSGNGVGPLSTPWNYSGLSGAATFKVGDRIESPNTHQADSYISEPLASAS